MVSRIIPTEMERNDFYLKWSTLAIHIIRMNVAKFQFTFVLFRHTSYGALFQKTSKYFYGSIYRKFASQGLRQKCYYSFGRCMYPNLLLKTKAQLRAGIQCNDLGLSQIQCLIQRLCCFWQSHCPDLGGTEIRD